MSPPPVPLSARILRGLLLATLRLPAWIRDPVMGPPPRNDRGVAIDSDTWTMSWLETHVLGGITQGTPPQARRAMRRSSAVVAARPDAPLHVEDGRVPGGAPWRLYRPPGPPRPVLLYLHGGGWVQGDRDTHDALCRRIAAEAGWTVVSLDYRLAPEHPFPAALEDVLGALRWLRTAAPSLGALPGRIAVGGDSAGGNLSAAVCIVLRDAGEPLPELQVLVYPAVDQRRQAPSHTLFATGYVLTTADVDWFQRHYGAPDPLDPRASPLLAASHAGLPPAIVTTAGFDPLRDEGEAYVARLRDAGVPVAHLDEAALVHGYAVMDGALSEANAAVERLLFALKDPPGR